MNLLDKLAPGLIIASLLSISSCKKENNIGIPKEPQDNIGAFFHDTTTIVSSVYWADSVATTFSLNNPFLLMGEYQDQYFGNLQAEAYTSMYLDPAANLATLPMLDSAIISFWPLITHDTARSLDKQEVQIFEIDDSHDWNISRAYFANSEALPIKSEPITASDFTYKAPKSGTTLLGKAFQARLKDDFAQKLLSLMQLSNTDFLKVFPGIALKAKGNRNIYSLRNLSSDTANAITLFYKDINGKSGRQKFLFGSDSTAYYRLIPDWSNTNLVNLNPNNRTISTNETGNLCYIQTGVGLYTKLSFPFILNNKKGRNVLINKAELIISSADASLYPSLNRPFLSVFQNSIDIKNIIPVSLRKNGNITENVFFASYQSSDAFKGYKIDLTNYIQKLLFDENSTASIYIGGAKQRLGAGVNPPFSNYLVDRAVFYDNKPSNSVANSQRMRLNLFYTIVD